MPRFRPSGPSPRDARSTDHTRWIAMAIELFAILAAVAFAVLHTSA